MVLTGIKLGGVTESEMDRGSTYPSLSGVKTQASEAEDLVVLLMSETIWTSVDTKSHI